VTCNEVEDHREDSGGRWCPSGFAIVRYSIWGETIVPRGQASEIGAERVAPNGYRYVKTGTGWELCSRLIAENRLGRKLRADEYVTFKDTDRTNLDPNNLLVQRRGRSSLKRQLALVDARILELTATKKELERRLKIQQKL